MNDILRLAAKILAAVAVLAGVVVLAYMLLNPQTTRLRTAAAATATAFFALALCSLVWVIVLYLDDLWSDRQ